MAETINTSGEVLRKLLLCFVDVSGGSATPEWEVQGYKVEESNIEYNVDSETMTDILGVTYTTLNKIERSQQFDPNTLKQGAKLSELLLQYDREDALEQFDKFKVLTVYGFLGTDGAWEADLWEGCSIYPDSLGGSTRVGYPFTINYGGEKKLGTVSSLTAPIFTAAT